MASLTETGHAFEVLMQELPGTISRSNVTLKSGTAFKIGDVLGKVTATGKYTVCDKVTPASDGSQTAVAVLLRDDDATSADVEGLVADFGCEINGKLLRYFTGSDAADKAAIAVDLAAKGVKVR